ncbi:MAG: SDR family oxidoreductase [Anaerolineae bacterium]|nr:SDR family oxidoreductase [Anaerolineae bacterium]
MRAADLPHLYAQLPRRYAELAGGGAIVTGASRGIGLGIAARLAREGMQVVLCGLEADELAAAAAALRGQGGTVTALPGDLTRPDDLAAVVPAALAACGRVDVLVNNAADIRRARLAHLPPDWLEQQWALNTRAPLLLCQQVMPTMRRQGHGVIVNISSVGGQRAQLPGLPYGLTKGALDALTRNLAMDLGEYGIRVNAVAPGWTPMNLDPVADADYLDGTAAYLSLRRPGTPQDIGAAVAFLASDDAAYITGQVLAVDGGLSAQLHPPQQPI